MQDYEVTESGKVFSRKFHPKQNPNRELREMKIKQDRYGYAQISLRVNQKRISTTVHRLVALQWIPNPENKPCVNHKNGNKLDNRVSNLEWCNWSENNLHAYNTGLKVRGSNTVKLTEEQIISIISDDRTQQLIANDYGISRAHVSKIKLKKTWKHL